MCLYEWICLYPSKEPQDMDPDIDELCVYWWIFEMNLSISKQGTTGYFVTDFTAWNLF